MPEVLVQLRPMHIRLAVGQRNQRRLGVLPGLLFEALGRDLLERRHHGRVPQQRLAHLTEHGELRDGLGVVSLHGPADSVEVGVGVAAARVLRVQQQRVQQQRNESVGVEQQRLVEVGDAEVQHELPLPLVERVATRVHMTVVRHLQEAGNVLLLERNPPSVIVSAPGCFSC